MTCKCDMCHEVRDVASIEIRDPTGGQYPSFLLCLTCWRKVYPKLAQVIEAESSGQAESTS